MVGKHKGTDLGPGHTLNGQRARRISRPTLKTGNWKARSMFERGKVHNAIREMKRLNIEILGISELRWPGIGERNLSEHGMLQRQR